MQTIETETVAVAEVTEDGTDVAAASVSRIDDQPTHRIYVWSSPSPYAVVVGESRSFRGA